MALSFQGLKNKLVAQVESNESLRRVLTPDQHSSRARKTSDNSSVTSETHSVSSNIDHNTSVTLQAVGSNSLNRSEKNFMNSSQLSLNSTIDMDNSSCANARSPNVQHSGDESSVCDGSSNQHIPSISVRPSSKNGNLTPKKRPNENTEATIYVPTSEEIDVIVTSYSQEQVATAFLKNKARLQNLKTAIKTVRSQNEELQKDQYKLTQLLESSQDKYMRKIGELKEAASLDKEAKAHMEGILRAELEEKSLIIESLNQKIAILKLSSLENDSQTPVDDQTEANKVSNLVTLNQYESFYNKLHSSLDVLTNKLHQKMPIDSSVHLETTSQVAKNCLHLVNKIVEEMQSIKSGQFNSDQIQNSINNEAKMLSYKELLKNSMKEIDLEVAQNFEHIQSLTNEIEELKTEHAATLETLEALQSDIKKKQSECESLREQGKSESPVIESLKNENEELVSKFFLAERQAEELKKESSNIQQKLQQRNEEMVQMLEQMRNLENNLHSAQSALDAKTAENEKFQDLITQSEQEVQNSRSEFLKLQNSTKSSTCKLEEENKTLASLLQTSEESHLENQKELASKSEKVENLEHKLKDTAGQLAAKEEDLKRLSEDVKAKQIELEDCYRTLEDRKLELGKLPLLESEIGTLRFEKASLEERLNSGVGENSERQEIVSEEVIESESSKTGLFSENASFGKSLIRAESSEESTQTAEDLECNLMSCSNDKLMLQAELTENKARIEELLGKIDCLSRTKYEQDKHVEKIKALETQKATLEELVASMNKERDSSVSALNDKIKELTQLLECKCNELETVVNVSNEDYDNCALENVEIKRNYHQLSQEFESMKAKLKSEKQQAVNDLEISMRDSFNKEIRVLNNEKLELNKFLDAAKKEIEDIREKYDNAVSASSQMTEKVESLESDASRLTKQVKSLSEALEKSETQLMGKVGQDVHSRVVEEKTNLELELGSLRDLHEKQTLDFGTERENFNKKIVDLEKAFTQADSNAVKMNELLDQYEKSYNEKLSKMSEEMQQQEQEVRFLKSSLEDSESKFEEMQAEFGANMKKVSDQKTILESEVTQYKDELKLKQKEVDENVKSVKDMKEKMETMKGNADQQKVKFDDYRRKVEEKFSSQKQIINEKFKAKEKEVVEMKEVTSNLELKLKTSEEEKESLARVNNLKTEEIEKLTQELTEGQKLLNSTLEQSQQDLESMKAKLEEEISFLKSENEKLEAELSYKNEGHVQDLEDEIRDMKAQIEAKECSINALKEEVSKKDNLIVENSLAHDEEKQSLTKTHFVERNKLSSDVKLLQNNVSELEMALANVKRDYQKYQMKMEDVTKKNKEQMENAKNSNTKERLAKDRELKVQADEIGKLKEAVQKMKSKHGEEVAEVKSKHANLVKNLDDQIRETKSSLQKTIDGLKKSHEEELGKVNAKNREEVTQIRLSHEQELKNLLLEHEQKCAAAEAELGKVLNDQIEDWKKRLDEKGEECEKLTSQVAQLTSKLQKETLAATLNEYKQKYENLAITSQNDLKRLEKQTDQKMKSMESRFNEEQRVLEKQVQEQKLIIANLEFEITDLESNYQAERSRNEVLSKEAKIAQKNTDLKSLVEAKESEIQRMEESAKLVLKSKEAEFEERLKSERDKIVREMDDFYSQKYEDMLSSEDQNANGDQSLQSLPNGSVQTNESSRNPAQLVLSQHDSPNFPSAESFKGSRESLFCFEDPTQMQFLRHILRQFILGSEKVVMARVLVTLAKFDEKDSKTILDAVKQSQKWIAF